MQYLGQDLRYAIKVLFAKPGFSLTAILTVALAIGANTAISLLIPVAGRETGLG